jgi:hypothetical protein
MKEKKKIEITKQKKKIEKVKDNQKRRTIFKKWWYILGLVILVWTAFWFVIVRVLNYYAFVINVMLLVIGYCLLINYALITIVYWAVRRLKREHNIK